MNEKDNGKFTVPRRLIEAWYLLNPNFQNGNCRSVKSDSMPFVLRIIRNNGYLITMVMIDSRTTAIHCRSVLTMDSPDAWGWTLDLASPLRNAMALSEFVHHLKISMTPAISVSFPQQRRRVRTFVGDSFDAKKANEVLSSMWIPLPPVAGNTIRQVVDQLERTIIAPYDDARLLLGNGRITLWAQQTVPVQEETVAEFDLGETKISGLSFSLPRTLLTSIFIQPIETFQVALCAVHQCAALILSDDSAIIFSTKLEMTNWQPSLVNSGVPLVPGPQDELFALLRPVGIMESGGSRSWFDNFDDLFLEAVRYLLTTPGEPCVTFHIDAQGDKFFEVARVHCKNDRWFVLNLSHRYDYQTLHKTCQEVQRETGLAMEGIGVDQAGSPYASGSFLSCLSPLDLRGPVRQVLRILWDSVPQVFSRVEWRNLDERHSGSIKVLERHTERKRFESVRFDRDRQPLEFIKDLYDNHCQVCGHRIAAPDGTAYSEAHHIRFLSQGGPDVVGNMLVLCPTHHKEFDLSILALDPDSYRIISVDPTHPLHEQAACISSEHRLDYACLEWAKTRQQSVVGKIPKPKDQIQK